MVGRRSSNRYTTATAGQGGGGGGGPCLICCGTVDPNRRPLKIPEEFGRKQVDVFLKICELLGVSFLEIRQDWSFPEGRDTMEGMPICLLCINGLHSVLKLQQQLSEIKRKIDDKLTSIREKIREASVTPVHHNSDPKMITFRLKALGQEVAAVAPPVVTYVNFTQPTSTWYNVQPSISSTPVVTTSDIWNQSHHAHMSTSPDMKPQYSSATPSEDLNLGGGGYYSDDGGAADDNYEDMDYAPPPAPRPPQPKEDSPPPIIPKRRRPGPKPGQKPTAPIPPALAAKVDPRVFDILFPAAPRKSDARPTDDRLKRTRPPETFAPIITDPEGRMTFEGIVITPVNGGYQCGQCGDTMGKDHGSISLRKAKIHIKGFHLNAYQCHVCTKNFTSQDILNQHVFRVHERGEIPCPTCGKPVKENHIRYHQYTHMNADEKAYAEAAGIIKPKNPEIARWPCRICGKRFAKPSKLRRHEAAHVDAQFRKDHKCEHCPKAFTTVQGLKEHSLSEHDPTNARKRLCTVCGVSVYWKRFKKHQEMHRLLQCPVCLKRYSQEKHYQHHLTKCGTNYKRKEGYEFQCEICLKYFSSQKNVNSHRRKHTGHWKLAVPKKKAIAQHVSVEDPAVGNLLDDLNNEGIQHVEGNRWSYQLYELDKIEEDDSGGWRCCDCEAVFKDEDPEKADELIMEHVRKAHVGNFRCNWCSKKMKNVEAVMAHARKEHTDQRGWDCDVCGRKQILLDTVKAHRWSHYNMEEMVAEINNHKGYPQKHYTEPMYNEILEEFGAAVNIRCELCDEAGMTPVEGLSTVRELWDHRLRKHRDVKVKIDARLPVQKKRGRKPVRHVPEWENGPPFPCLHCHKPFSRRHDVQNHMRKVHEGNKKKPKKRRREWDSDVDDAEMEELEQVIKKEVMTEDEMEEDDEKGYTCEVCGASFRTRRVKKHVWSHMSWEEMQGAVLEGESIPMGFDLEEVEQIRRELGLVIQTECGICGEGEIQGIKALLQHRKTRHPEIKEKHVPRKKNRQKPGPKPRAPEKGPVPCPYCGKKWKTRYAMRHHTYRVHKKERQQDALKGTLPTKRWPERQQDPQGGWTSKQKGGKKRRNVKVICEEDELEGVQEQEQMEVWDEGVQVKQEVFPMSSDEEGDGGVEEGEWVGEEPDEEEEEQVKNPRRSSLRDRRVTQRYREEASDSEEESGDEYNAREEEEESESEEEDEEIKGWY